MFNSKQTCLKNLVIVNNPQINKKKMLILILLTLFSSSSAVSMNVASFMLYPTELPFILDANYTDPSNAASTVLQLGWSSGFQLYRDVINDLGGFQIYDDNNVTNVLINITFFNVARPTDNSSTQLLQMQKIMTDIVVQKKYGDIPYIIGPPTPYQQAAPFDQLASICEETKACIFFMPITIDPKILTCLTPNVECTRRGKRFGRRFLYSISTAPASLETVDTWISTMIGQGAKSIAIIRCPDWDAQANWASKTSKQNKLPVVYDHSFDPNNNALSTWRLVVEQLRDVYKPDILVLFIGFSALEGLMCSYLFKAMEELDWFPKGLHFASSCQAVAPYMDPDWQLKNYQAYTYGVLQFTELAVGSDYRAISMPGSLEPFSSDETRDSPQVFFDKYLERFGMIRTVLGGGAIIGGQAILPLLTIQKMMESRSLAHPTPTELLPALFDFSVPSHYGLLRYDPNGEWQDRPYNFVQYGFNGLSTIITPVVIGTTPIYPAPTWSERKFYEKYFDHTLEKLMVSCTTIALSYIVVLGLLLFVYRDHAVIRASTPWLCAFVVIGSFLFIITNYFWTLHESDMTCMMKLWTLSLGFTCSIMAIIIKTYRIWKIFDINEEKLKRVYMPTSLLLKWLSTCCFIDVLYLVLWHTIAPLTASIRISDPYRPSKNYTMCATSASAVIFAVILIVLKSCTLLIASFMAFRVRKVPLAFNETLHIAITVFLSFFMVSLGVPIAATLPDRVYAFMVRAVCIILFGVTVPTIMIGSKLTWIWFEDTSADNATNLVSSNNSTNNNSSPGLNVRKVVAPPSPTAGSATAITISSPPIVNSFMASGNKTSRKLNI